MPKNAHPHVSWRGGRPRFQPGPSLRAAGHRARDLRHEDGRWFSRGEAVDWSDAFVKSLGRQKRARPAPAVPADRYTVAHLFEEWFRSPKFQRPADDVEARKLRAAGAILADKTAADYRKKSRVIEQSDPDLWMSPADALDRVIVYGLYERLVAARGIATARGVIVVLSAALAWGAKRGKVTFRLNHGANPAQKLDMATPAPRVRFATRREMEALVAAADFLGAARHGGATWHELGDMVTLGVWSGQRQGDRLLLDDKGLMRGRRIFRQGKTGAIVAVLQAPELEARLARAAQRRREAGIVNPRVVLNEKTWAPYDEHHYRDRYAILRSYAAAGIIDVAGTAAMAARHRAEGRNELPPLVWHVAPCPSLLADAQGLALNDADLRDTAVVWMALSGCTIPEIISVTGHSPASATTILKHYLARHPEMADAAIRKMMTWYEADGETEIGL